MVASPLAATVGHWLVHHGLYNYILGWAVGTIMTAVIAGIIVRRVLRPTAKYLREEIHHHRKVQDHIANQLDTNTPGGLTDINHTLQRLERAEQEQAK